MENHNDGSSKPQAPSGVDSAESAPHSTTTPMPPPSSSSSSSTSPPPPPSSAFSAGDPELGAALARFEFEEGKGKDGTKVIVVEWDPSASTTATGTSASDAAWDVSWEGKSTHLPATDRDVEEGAERKKRVYFLLPPGSPVPPLISITCRAPGQDLKLEAKPLPAIFSPALGVSSADFGTRGVLHTKWARKRLSELQAEMAAEMATNGESVGLEMAAQEAQWILDHFGVGQQGGDHADPSSGAAGEHGPEQGGSRPGPSSKPTPQQVSPVGGRLSEKLKGLKLVTTAADLRNQAAEGKTDHSVAKQRSQSTFSPHSSDVAVGAYPRFTALQGASKPLTNEVQSLDAVLGQGASQASQQQPQTSETEEDLFALPMSPRSPEMTTSPFSFR